MTNRCLLFFHKWKFGARLGNDFFKRGIGSGEFPTPGFLRFICPKYARHLQKRDRDVAVLRLYKGLGQRIIKLGRCLLSEK